MSVWDEVVGQQPTVEVLTRAVQSARTDGAAMTHAWLFTGPPGSGRSIAARAFAAALLCQENEAGCGRCHACHTVLAGSHADVTTLRTEGVIINRQQALDLISVAQRSPSVGRWRVIVVEDADRLTEHSGNALLKAIEEPTARTVWLLCAPSADDVLVTIRSRCRHVGLRTPPPEAVAALLVERDGVDPQMAVFAARAAQSHIGMARRLATDEQSRIRRREVLQVPLRLRSVGEAVLHAAQLLDTAKAEAEDATTERDARERTDLLRALGADPDARTQPLHVRAQLKTLADNQKRRATRFVRDMIDRSLLDLLSLYRDVLVVHADPAAELVNAEMRPDVERLAQRLSPAQAVQCMDAIRDARERIGANVAPLLALEAMAVRLRLPA
ncbi:DNA polymerase III subunit delta' [Angustibacter sp. Root456]|uniref:DNA polymerase III subunit delta' n=1 Tax=Angustibacter sp. Root456 TaxID=1736539 RepID=UPI0006FAE5C4|nr:DNA polymerase III subunit delta' [Angustibacter sp. Root456]KQX61628.1 DNA polymerase III subunit delta' [Angustibacter sp. Root456]